jgi:hypothetical protein
MNKPAVLKVLRRCGLIVLVLFVATEVLSLPITWDLWRRDYAPLVIKEDTWAAKGYLANSRNDIERAKSLYYLKSQYENDPEAIVTMALYLYRVGATENYEGILEIAKRRYIAELPENRWRLAGILSRAYKEGLGTPKLPHLAIKYQNEYALGTRRHNQFIRQCRQLPKVTLSYWFLCDAYMEKA